MRPNPKASRVALKLITPPEAEPVSLDEAKLHLRVWDDAEDRYIVSLIQASRQWCENYLRRSLITTKWRQTFGSLPRGGVIELARPPLVEVTRFEYVNDSGVTTTVPAELYSVDIDSEAGRIVRGHDLTWPTVRTTGVTAAVTVEFNAGYGPTAASVPDSIRHAMLLMMGHWYENRSPVVVGSQVNSVPRSAEALLATQRWGSYP